MTILNRIWMATSKYSHIQRQVHGQKTSMIIELDKQLDEQASEKVSRKRKVIVYRRLHRGSAATLKCISKI